MLNVYQVVDSNNGSVMATGFESRSAAKPKRNELNGPAVYESRSDAKPRYGIARGSDHPLGETDGRDHSLSKKWL